jgi:hypothetical protein
MAENGVIEEEGHVERDDEGSLKRRRTGSRHCGIYRKTGHNVRTCPEVREIDGLSNSE